MSDSKGPQIDLPPELRDELESDYSDVSGDVGTGATGTGPVETPAPESAAEVVELQRQLAELNDKYLRLAAEYDNFRRRSLRERQEAIRFGHENLVKEVLASIDNLERAIGHGRSDALGPEGLQLLEGVELTHRSLLQGLEKFGVQEVAALGVVFDPSVHQAVRQVASDEHPAGTVSEVLQKGYLLSDRLLRPALVGVSSGPAEKPDPS